VESIGESKELVNVTLATGLFVLAAVTLGIAIEVYRLRTAKRRKRRSAQAPRRLPQLEARMADAFSGPRAIYGDCFAEFSIWRQSETTRMDVATKSAWTALNLFTRSLIVRHLWRQLAGFAKTAPLVHVDPGTANAIVWSAVSTAQFDDKGVKEPWVPAKGRVGTLISGP
jgi:hypothetical protein